MLVKVHLIGIAGTGMGALAGLLKAKGFEVRGSDKSVYPPMSDQLTNLGIDWFDGFKAENLDWGPDIVVVGNICSATHPEVVAAKEKGLELKSLPQMIGEELIGDKHSIVVAGTHGKTTTTSLLSVLFTLAKRDPSFMVGGVPLQIGKGWEWSEKSEEFIVEGDEYDSAFFDKGSKFLHYRPKTAILTSVENDHVDIFEDMDAIRATFRKFVKLIPEDGLLVVSHVSKEAMMIAKECSKAKIETFAVAVNEDMLKEFVNDVNWVVGNLSYFENGRCKFDLFHDGVLFDQYQSSLTGNHNLANICSVVAVGKNLGIAKETIRNCISTFAGVERRQQLRGIAQGVYVIDDYAHHPTAVRLTLEGLRHRFKGRRLLALFEPRSATSRRNVFQKEFAEAFGLADQCIVGPLYAPDKIPVEERLDPELLVQDIKQAGAQSSYIDNVDGILEHVSKEVRPGDVVVVCSSGAFGDIHCRLLRRLGDAVMPAHGNHRARVRSLLESLGMLYSDVNIKTIHQYFVLENEKGIVGTVGLEIFGADAVLRSLAVAKDSRGAGYGWMLADTVIQHARYRGVSQLYLVTKNAGDFFAGKHGFREVELSTLPAHISESPTFNTQDDQGVAMRLDLTITT